MNMISRDFNTKDASAVSQLIEKVFDKYIANDFFPEGVNIFKQIIQPDNIIIRQEKNKTFVVELDSNIVGMIEVTGNSHIMLFFVDDKYHRNGIGKILINKAIESARINGHKTMTVNSSIFAINIYEKFGFIKQDDIKTKDGIVYQEMLLNL